MLKAKTPNCEGFDLTERINKIFGYRQ